MRKWLFIILSLLTIVAYQNCSGRHEDISGVTLDSDNSTTVDDVDMVKSLAAFEKSVFPITQAAGRCVICHGESQQPLFALSNSESAHDIIISFGLVNLRNPSGSKIVEKLTNGHQGYPQTLTTEVLTAIEDWSEELIANGGLIGVGDGVQPLFSSLLTHVFEPKCTRCHSDSGEAPQIDYSSYLDTLNTGQVIPGNAALSGVYIHTKSEQEPRGDGEVLTADELNALKEWINLGALPN